MNKDNRSKLIVVFLKNKLISFDSILPLAMEINKCCGYKFYFIIWEYESYRSVVEDNVALRDMALSVGSIVCPSKINSGIISDKINKVIFIAKVLLKISLKKFYILHFNALDEYPLALLTKVINKDKIARCESSVDVTMTLAEDMDINCKNTITASTLQERSSGEESHKHMLCEYPVNNSGILIGFDSNWNWFKHPDANSCKKLVFSSGRNAKEYRAFISKNCDYYLRQEGLLNLDKNKTIVLILGHYGYGGKGTGWSVRNKLLYEALVVLKDLECNIIIKPHIYCDMDLVKSIIKDSKCDNRKIYYTKIHPQIIQQAAIAGLFVNNSTVRCNYIAIGFPVIQYNGGLDNDAPTDRCSGIVCSSQDQLNNSIKSLMNSHNDESITIKEENIYKYDCDEICNIINC